MKKSTKNISVPSILFLVWIMLFSGCQKVIDVDLNSVNAEIVIEGGISDQLGPHEIRLSKTVNFDEPNVFPGIPGAVVTISDNAGNIETLSEVTNGVYRTITMSGVPGRNYFLNVAVNDKDYKASSYMHQPVPIDTIIVDSLTFGQQSNKFIQVEFADPVGIENFYKAIQVINGDTLDRINIATDEFADGEALSMSIFSDMDPGLKSGDEVVIILQSIDESVYNYLYELTQILSGGGTSAAPANPTTNIDNSALGFFSAHSVTSKTIVVP